MTKLRPRSFHDQIVEELGQKIVAGTLDNMQLPPEAVLAESLGVGRLVLREAMKVLAAKGLVTIRPKTGTHVLPRENWNLYDPRVLAWHANGAFDKKFVADLMELRNTIEPAAARLAASRASEAQIETMRLAYQAMETAQAQDDYIAADLQFHGAMLHSCGNQFISQLENALSEVLRTSFKASTASSDPAERSERALPLHKALLTAIERHDPDAAQAATENLIMRATQKILGSGLLKGSQASLDTAGRA
jgi:GntR family galactonate operon transcriptional repressor